MGSKREHIRQGCRRYYRGAGHHLYAGHQVLRLGRGVIIELDASEDDAGIVLANNLPVAKGTVAVNGNRLAVNVSELLPRPPDMR